MDEHSVPLTQELWKSLSDEELKKMFLTGALTGEVAGRAWRMAGSPGACPDRLTVYVNKADVERMCASIAPGGSA